MKGYVRSIEKAARQNATVGRIANKQLGRVQGKAIETANEAEDAIRRNPFSAIAIAVGLGFLFGVFTRR